MCISCRYYKVYNAAALFVKAQMLNSLVPVRFPAVAASNNLTIIRLQPTKIQQVTFSCQILCLRKRSMWLKMENQHIHELTLCIS